MRWTLKIQLLCTSGLLVIFSILISGFLLLGHMTQQLRSQIVERGELIASHLALISEDFLLAHDSLALANFASRAQENKGVVYAQIVDKNGLIKAASPSQGIESRYSPPAGLDKWSGQDMLLQRYFDGKQWVLDIAVGIKHKKQNIGQIYVGMDENIVFETAVEIRKKSIFLLVLILVSALILTYFLAVALAKPVEEMHLAAKKIGEGRLETRLHPQGPAEIKMLGQRFNEMAEGLQEMVRGVIQSLVTVLAMQDRVSPGHSERVARYASRTAKIMKLSFKEQENIRLAAQLIDIGHIGLPTGLLHKSGPLSDEELKKLRTHPYQGSKIIETIPMLKQVVPMLMHHHERWDGRGYPLGLKEKAIPIGARILAVADSFDAMLTEKRHRRARNRREAIEELKRCSGQQFDPKVVEAFCKQLSED
jgi:HD-GYP domain-containing protein (c-di-GMP phosphodiesterase class II)